MNRLPLSTTVNIRSRSLAIGRGDTTHHFDRSGRLTFSTRPGETIRRSLDDRALRVTASAGARDYEQLSARDKERWYTGAIALAAEARGQDADPVTSAWLARIATQTPWRLAGDAEAFARVYLPVSILPPDQYHALVVQVSHGCSYNRCLFCDFYRDRPFHVKTPAELGAHIDGLREFFAERLADRSGVFLGDGNALVIPTGKLLGMMDVLRREFGPIADPFSTFMDTFTLDHKTRGELADIRAAGLTTVYSGLETGSDRLRAVLRKPGTAVEAADALNLLKATGFRLGVIVIVGVGGPQFAAEHLQDTLDTLRSVNLTRQDIVFLSPFVDPGLSDFDDAVRRGLLSRFGDEEVGPELARWRRALAGLPARVTTYSLKEYMYW